MTGMSLSSNGDVIGNTCGGPHSLTAPLSCSQIMLALNYVWTKAKAYG